MNFQILALTVFGVWCVWGIAGFVFWHHLLRKEAHKFDMPAMDLGMLVLRRKEIVDADLRASVRGLKRVVKRLALITFLIWIGDALVMVLCGVLIGFK